jgi:hypothetical protein
LVVAFGRGEDILKPTMMIVLREQVVSNFT